MLAEERKREIIDLVNKNKIMKVTDLSQILSATEATIRRDLDELQDKKKIRRIHGGAISIKPSSIPFLQKDLRTFCIEEKKMIAAKAYDFIDDNDSIILDASTTVLELAKEIARGDKKNLFIITNSFYVVSVLSEKKSIHVFHTGGEVSYNMNFSVGSTAENTLRNLRTDKCFVGTNGIDPQYGFSVPTFDDCAVKRCMIQASKQKFVLADHTKFDDSYIAKFANFTGEVDYLITDLFPANIDRSVYDANVNLLVVGL